jgi:membrane-bound serine protease (ClpP class)
MLKLTRLFLLGLAAWLGAAGAHAEAAAQPLVWLIQIDGPIGPATADYFTSNLKDAEAAGAALFVVELDTPGGLDHSMRDMIKAILASSVPVATYVWPNGSRAASAGTYLMYASHIAAMAPATNIGSSTPVSIGGEGSPFPTPSAPQPSDDHGTGKSDDGKSGESGTSGHEAEPHTAMERKVLNDAVAYIRGLAKLRGRNEQWAEATVREAANLTAADALDEHVIDLIAPNLNDLLKDLDGRQIKLEDKTVTLQLKGAEIKRIAPGWRYELLSLITDPNVAYILLMIGIYGLILEFYNPGTGVPGVIGVICLLLGAYALQMLPVNYAGLALLVLGIGLMVAEAFTPSFGVLGVGGAIAFVIGSIILMDTDLPAYQISKSIIASVATAAIGISLFVIGAAVRARNRKISAGREAMIGGTGEALEDITTGHGMVRAFGELWQVETRIPIAKGTRVRIVAIDGLTLTVEPKE